MPLYGDQPVNVNVGFSTFLPLPDLSDQTLASTQTTGRSVIYRLARDECAVLKATIAKTCRLTNINVSTRIEDHDSRRPLKLHLNGNAQFAISGQKAKCNDLFLDDRFPRRSGLRTTLLHVNESISGRPDHPPGLDRC
jgi:hypothetical protein